MNRRRPAGADLPVRSCQRRAVQTDRRPAGRRQSPDVLAGRPPPGGDALGGRNGIRLYDRDRGWGEAARDADYGDKSYGAAFAPDGRLATTSFDGKVRLYAAELQGAAHPAVAIDAPDGRQPFGVAFSPTDATRLAIGYDDGTAVTLLDGASLAELPEPDVTGITGGKIWQQSPGRRTADPCSAAVVAIVDGGNRPFSPGPVGAGNRHILPAAPGHR